MKLFNCHSHTLFSHDGKGTPEENCITAEKRELLGFAVTDHLDTEYSADPSVFGGIEKSFYETKRCREKYKNRLIVACGVEIGEAVYDPAFAKRVIDSFNWDVILGSVHAVRIKSLDMPFSTIDFSGFTDEELHRYITQYFFDMNEMLDTQDFDILCHLTVVLRYIVYKYRKTIDISYYYPVITEILKKAIKRDIALEINTSGMADGYLMPDRDILRLYKSLGGKRLTIGSDSHSPEYLTNVLSEGVKIIKAEGFDTLSYYIDRKPAEYKI